MRTIVIFLVLAFGAFPGHATQVQFSTVLPPGASPVQVKTDASGNIYIGGNTSTTFFSSPGFIAKFSPEGSRLIFYAPGPLQPLSHPFIDALYFLSFCIGPDGSIYVASDMIGGYTTPFGSFISKIGPNGGAWLSPNGNAWVIDTPLANIPNFFISDIAADAQGNIYVSGKSVDIGNGLVGGNYLVKFDSTLENTFYSLPGYGGGKIAVDAQGDVFTVTSGNAIPTTPGAYQSVAPTSCNANTLQRAASNGDRSDWNSHPFLYLSDWQRE